MAFVNLKFFSETLDRNVDINAIVPQRSAGGDIGISNRGSQEKYKTLLLLHGLSDDNTIWCRRTSIERYAVEHGTDTFPLRRIHYRFYNLCSIHRKTDCT